MNDILLKLYHHLPSPMRSLAATFRGLYLRSWRYGPETDDLVAEALERESWSRAQWEAYREERLAYILHRAATTVPYYRNIWEKRRRKGDRSSWELVENWPILEKDALRAAPESFLADGCAPSRMFHLHTSGTTGTPLSLWRSHSTLIQWYALFEARWRRWYGVSRDDRWAILGGQLVTPVDQRRPPFWVWNGALKQLYMSSYHLAPDLIPYYFSAIRRYQIRYLWGYSSSLYSLAREALERGITDWNIAVVIANAEPLFDYQRDIIEAAFSCPVRETYGMTEMVAAASECEYGELHLWPEAGVVEIVDEEHVAADGQQGDIVSTGLLGSDMPLIRYRVGDRGSLSPHQACDCGRTLPIVDSIEGRADDMLYTHDGRRIGRLDPIFKADLPIREAQIVQESLSTLVVRYVPLNNFSQETRDTIAMQLKERMGPVDVVFEEMKSIPRTSRGKFRAVVCHIDASEVPNGDACD